MIPMLMYIQSENLNQDAVIYLEMIGAEKKNNEYVTDYSLDRVLKLIFRDQTVDIKIIKCEEMLK